MNHIKTSDRGELIFWKETLKFTKDWALKSPNRPWIQNKRTLEVVARIAAEPVWAAWFYDDRVFSQICDAHQAGANAREHHEIHKIADLYQQYPDFFPGLLNHLRGCWAKLEGSLFGRVMTFLTLGFAVNPHHKEEEEKLRRKDVSPHRYQCDPGPYNRKKAIGTWAGFTAITTALGPVSGGWLSDNLSWRWAFFINVPLALITATMTRKFVPELRPKAAGPALDLKGAVTSTLGLGSITLGLVESARAGFRSPYVWLALFGGLLLLLLFLRIESASPAPMLPLGLFKSKVFSVANIVMHLRIKDIAVTNIILRLHRVPERVI